MFCTNCGCAQTADSVFCTNCGAQLSGGAPAVSSPPVITPPAVSPPPVITPPAGRPLTKEEYFSGYCSSDAAQILKRITIMGWIGLVLQGILSVFSIITWIVFEELVSSDPWVGGGAEIILIIPAMIAVFAALSFTFTILGIKRKSTGFLTAAAVFAFFATSLGGSIFDSVIRLFLAFGMLVLYVVMAVFSSQANAEYKSYIQRNFMYR